MSEQIKPWTNRHQKSPQQLAPFIQKQSKPVIKDRHIVKYRLESQTDFKSVIQKPLQLPLLQPQAILRARRLINEKLAENLGITLNMNERSNFLPNYNLINICFSSSNGGKKSKKDKKIPYHINSLRQYTDNHELKNQNVSKNRSEIGRIRRYYTQQRGENKNSINDSTTHQQSSLIKMQRQSNQAQSRNDPSLKLISHKNRSLQRSQKCIQKGALYEQIDKLCNIKSIKNNKLTFMKRTYNLKRLQKILS